MEANEIIECYNTLSDYAKSRVAALVKDLHSVQESFTFKLFKRIRLICNLVTFYLKVQDHVQ